MQARKTLLDTDTLSAVMQRKPPALIRASAYRAVFPQFSYSLITHFEVMRGFKAINATTQLRNYEVLRIGHEVLPITESVVVRAADIYADLHRRGELIPDADLIIGATALEYGCALATNNVGHFGRITGLIIDNWLA